VLAKTKTQGAERGEARILPMRGKRGESWRVRFCLDGRNYSSRCVRLLAHAKTLAAKANGVLPEIRSGLRRIPTGVAVAEFVFAGGQLDAPSGAVASPSAPMDEKKAGITLAELLDRYEASLPPEDEEEGAAPRAKELSTYGMERIHLRHFRRVFEKTGKLRLRLEDATPSVFEGYMNARTGVVQAPTVNKERITLRSIYKFAINEKFAASNPLDAVKPLPEEKPLDFLTIDEIEDRLKRGVFSTAKERRLRRACYLLPKEVLEVFDLVCARSRVFVPVAVAMFTGARLGEVAKLTWADVDLDRRDIVLRSKKQSRTVREIERHVEIAPQLAVILAEHKAKVGGRGHVFPGRRPGTHVSEHSLHGALVRALRGTRYALVRYHNLRHSFATNLATRAKDPVTGQPLTLKAVMEYLGHTTPEMALRYQHVTPSQRRGVVEQLFAGLAAEAHNGAK
jgi:integrase